MSDSVLHLSSKLVFERGCGLDETSSFHWASVSTLSQLKCPLEVCLGSVALKIPFLQLKVCLNMGRAGLCDDLMLLRANTITQIQGDFG